MCLFVKSDLVLVSRQTVVPHFSLFKYVTGLFGFYLVHVLWNRMQNHIVFVAITSCKDFKSRSFLYVCLLYLVLPCGFYIQESFIFSHFSISDCSASRTNLNIFCILITWFCVFFSPAFLFQLTGVVNIYFLFTFCTKFNHCTVFEIFLY